MNSSSVTFCIFCLRCSMWKFHRRCLQSFHPRPETNACQLILKYLLMNEQTFSKAYHDRLYYFSSGTKFSAVCVPLKKWMENQNKLHKKFLQDPIPNKRPPEVPETLMKKYVYGIFEIMCTCLCVRIKYMIRVRCRRLIDENGLFALLGDTLLSFMIA